MNKQLQRFLKAVVIVGNIMFVIWILFNGMDSGWKATPVQLASYVGIIILLGLNTYFITRSG